jgi:RNA polymerase sigma-70 factor, ECF subfamily
MNSIDEQPSEQAFRMVLAHRTMLKAYVGAIVRDPVLAEDCFSEVTLEIVRSWARFDVDRPFQPWARGIARRIALANLRKQARQPSGLDEQVLEFIGAELDSAGNEVQLEERKQALERCLELLSDTNRKLVRLRYFENCSYQEVSEAMGRSLGALYVVFNRIHHVLAKCIERGLR